MGEYIISVSLTNRRNEFMRKVTMNEYIELIDELCAKCDSGELTEEGVNDILAEITISEWKSDPREPHDVPDDYIPPSNNT